MAISILVPFGGAIPNYSALLTEVAAYIDNSDLGPRLPTFVSHVEERVNRDLRLLEMEGETLLSATAETVLLPDDFLSMRSIHVEGSPDRPLRGMSASSVAANYNGTAGIPVGYVQIGRSSLQLVPPPADATVLKMRYYQRIDPLSDGNPRNWLLQYYPSVYLFGCLAYAAAFLDDDRAMAKWLPAFEQALNDLEAATKRDRHGSAPLVPNSVVQVRGASC